ncbi:MAG: flagellar filament capping protein FliD [Betaproteobacteria bacterium]
MASGSISSPGLGSNLDVSGIVSKLMTVEAAPLNQLNTREGSLQAQISLLGQIKSTVSGIQTAARALKTAASASVFRATSSDASVLNPTTSAGAVAGSHDITVTKMAQAQSIVSAGQASRTASIGAGTATTLTISAGSISGGTLDTESGVYTGATFTANAAKVPVTVNLDGTNNTLEGIRDAINAANAGVTASVISDGAANPHRLVIKANDSGSENSIKIAVSGDAMLQGLLTYDPAGTQNLSQLQGAQSAQLTVDGVAVTSANNLVDAVIDGVTLNLKATGSATVTVSKDNTGLTAALSQLAKSYNDANKAIGDATRKGADLQGDYGTVTILNRLRGEIGALKNGFGPYSSLSQFGATFQRDGSLAFDSSKLLGALNGTDSLQAASMIGNFTAAIKGASDSMLGSNGSLQARTDGVNRSIKDIGNQRDVLNRRLTQIQARYLAQFNALDALMGRMQQTSTYLTQQLANLSKIGK